MSKLWEEVNPWDIEVNHHVKRGIDPEKARTSVIFRWMYHGDFRPLIIAIRDNWDIDHAVLNLHVAWMAMKGRLTTTAKRRGRPISPEAQVRDLLAATVYQRTDGGSNERFDRVAGAFGTSHQSIRRAVTAHRKRR